MVPDETVLEDFADPCFRGSWARLAPSSPCACGPLIFLLLMPPFRTGRFYRMHSSGLENNVFRVP